MVNIAAPPGEPLTLGSYTGAVRAAFRGPGEPGLDVFGDGRGCNTVSGQFDVTELSYAPTGELLVFDATFEQHCEGGPAALFGRIRIESTPPPPDVTPPTLNLPSEVNVEAPDASGTYVSYAAYATDDRDPSPTLTCTPSSGSLFPVGTTMVDCEAADTSGNVVTGSFPVHVYQPLELDLGIGSKGTVDTRTGAATVTGTVVCSRAIESRRHRHLDAAVRKPRVGCRNVLAARQLLGAVETLDRDGIWRQRALRGRLGHDQHRGV
jgi:HYR domain